MAETPFPGKLTQLPPIPVAPQAGEVYQKLPDGMVDGVLHTHARQTIQATPDTLYAMWSRIEEFPRWQEHVVSVTRTGDRTSHWVMGDPTDADGKRIEFDSELTADESGKRIAWRSTSGDVEQQGEVVFATRRDGRGTVVTLFQTIKVPGGKVGNAVASTMERGPRQTVIENLRHFKQMAETGEIATVAGQPHGPRGISGKAKAWMYGETNPTPAGTREQGTEGAQ